MFDYIKQALNGNDNTVSSRRLITFISMFIGVIVDISIIVLAFKVALASTGNANAISAISKLIELTMIIKIEIFLLIGIITWQNINDTAKIVKGIPTTQTDIEATIKQKTTETVENIQNGGISQ